MAALGLGDPARVAKHQAEERLFHDSARSAEPRRPARRNAFANAAYTSSRTLSANTVRAIFERFGCPLASDSANFVA